MQTHISDHTSKDELVKQVLYDMMDYVVSSISLYQHVCVAATGKGAILRRVATPFIEEYQARALAKSLVAT